MIISETDRAWAAGFFEGEGSIRIRRTKSKTHSLEIHLKQVDPSPLEWLKTRWNGQVKGPFVRKINWRPLYQWRVRERQAALFLASIKPFIVRAHVLNRIELALAFQSQRVARGNRIGPAQWQNQNRLCDQMHRLNDRGNQGHSYVASDAPESGPQTEDKQLDFFTRP